MDTVFCAHSLARFAGHHLAMRVLFFHSNSPDYLSDSLFHGLRSLLGHQCVDVPRCDSMYEPLPDGIRAKLRGNGFTLYGLLEDDPQLAAARYFWRAGLDQYDLIVISDIWRQWRLFQELQRLVHDEKLVVVDGSDAATWFPFSSSFKTTPSAYFSWPLRVKYFKRELIGSGAHLGAWTKKLPHGIRKQIPLPENSRPISFSIPAVKIFEDSQTRTREFPSDIVDEEVALDLNLPLRDEAGQYPFRTEHEYYADLRN